ncbi:MAG TPA: MFS transporter [Ramlibacter sp.]|jgi:predicted MFS family arabinose efflux permease|uniref:MFS transporter n=1 Tax=Ramlibacter sp. TaxID=1917967 RepID=UPI002D513E8C|nr:MFS transporter [Ramlibacter sp.]HZY18990.1 MFS transporter [Ramlibacter sp.]
MTMCVALLIAAEFMPVSLLTPIARDLGATDGMAGQAISISGLFAVLTSLLVATVAGRFDRRHVLMALTASMLGSLVLIALAPSFSVLMVARALLGVTVGGFWALSTATVMRLVPRAALARAMGVLYMGNAVATAVAAPVGSFLGGWIGWRGVFWLLVPLAVANLAWQWASLPAMRPPAATPALRVLSLLRRRHVAFAMLAVMLSFGGAFATFTYLRPFLETVTHATLPQLSLLLLGLGAAGFVGTSAATALLPGHLQRLLGGLPLALAAATLALLAGGGALWPAALAMVLWGGLNAAIPVCWSNWLAQGVADEPEAGGGLMVAAIQLAIMAGAAFGGWLLDAFSVQATFAGGAALLVLAAATVGRGRRLLPAGAAPRTHDAGT